MYKNVNTISDEFFCVMPQHAGVIDDVIIIGRRRIYCASTLLWRCLCKCIDVSIITLLCIWRIYAPSERLLVLKQVLCEFFLSEVVLNGSFQDSYTYTVYFYPKGGLFYYITFKTFLVVQFCPTFDMLFSGPNSIRKYLKRLSCNFWGLVSIFN